MVNVESEASPQSNPAPARSTAWNRWDWILLAIITAIGAVLRLYQLGHVPPGFQFDEAFNAIDAKQVLAGHFPLFLPANGGREALYTYWQASIGLFLGIDVYSLRLASAMVGIATIPASYLLLRRLLTRDSRLIAAFTSLTLALSLWHIHFSRYGIRVIMMPLLLCGVMGFFWLGGHAKTRGWRLLSYAICGLLVGLTPWTHPAGRLVPFVLFFYVLWMLWRQPATRRWELDSLVGGLLITGLVALLVFLPLGLEFLRHPDFFFGHASEVSIFAERVSGGEPLAKLLDNILHVLGMFSIYGDVEWAHNLAGRPVFDPVMAIVFSGGVLLWALRLWRRTDPDFDALSLLAIWSLVLLLPSVLSEAAPNYSRTLPSLPATFVAAGLGLTWIATFRWPRRWIGPAIAAAILLVSTASTVQDYFVRFAQRAEVYYLYDADKLDALEYLATFTEENSVYLSQLWGDKHATVYLLRGRLGIESIDTADTVVLPPPGRGAVYAFPAEQQRRAEALAAIWPESAVTPVLDRFGQSLIFVVHVPAQALESWPDSLQPDQANEARFFEAPTLLGLQQVDETADLVLFWRSDGHTFRDLTAFIHLIDVDGKRIGQVDKLPGNGSYRTPFWRVGERVIDRYSPEISDPCSAGESVRVQVGWYQYLADNARMARTDAPGDSALAGSIELPLRSMPADRLAPKNLLQVALSDDLGLMGYALHSAALQPGAPLRLDLFWTRSADSTEPAAQVLLRGTGDDVLLWEGAVAPGAEWIVDEALCRRLRLQLPADLDPGDYELVVMVGDAATTLETIEVAESTRSYLLPPVGSQSGVTFGDVVKLYGFETLADGEALTVSLVWQAIQRPAAKYKVFVHLVDQSGQIVAQSDSEPAEGYATDQWLPGEVVVDKETLLLPAGVDTSQARLLVGLYDPVSGQRLTTVSIDGQRLPDDAVTLELSAPAKSAGSDSP